VIIKKKPVISVIQWSLSWLDL